VVEKCRVALGRLRECGPDWNRLSLEHLVELVRSEPRANLERVVRRIEQDWKGQSVPAIKTPPMIVRQCLGWDVADGGRNAKKNAAPTVEELRERRMGGRRNDE
jgi:hypothetical protein